MVSCKAMENVTQKSYKGLRMITLGIIDSFTNSSSRFNEEVATRAIPELASTLRLYIHLKKSSKTGFENLRRKVVLSFAGKSFQSCSIRRRALQTSNPNIAVA